VTLLLGAVAYDPKVVSIWDGFRRWFNRHDFAFDYVLYSHYDRQVDDLIDGRIDVAWNSPLAWVRARRLGCAAGRPVQAVAMRDTDRQLTSVVVTRSDSQTRTVSDLDGALVATGALDSPQATLLPLHHLRDAGIDVQVRRFDDGLGLHGDHIGGEREAARALLAGEVEAACMLAGSHLLFSQDGTLHPGSTRVLAETTPYDHCNMTAGPTSTKPVVDRFVELLVQMDYADPDVRPLLDLEGLTRWLPGRVDGYDQLERAVDALAFYDAQGAHGNVNY
jgi:phosphonate transport system substrate-binding protein